MKTLLASTTLALIASAQGATLTGHWTFDNSANPLEATVGTDLIVSGTPTIAPGITAGDGAYTTDNGIHYSAAHNIAANGGGTRVNQFSLVWDISLPTSSTWLSLYDNDGSSNPDGNLFVRNSNNTIGRNNALGGYTTNALSDDTWYRVVLTVDLSNNISLYVDGTAWKTDFSTLTVDQGEFSLAVGDSIRFFDDNGNDEGPVTVSTLAIFDGALTSQEAAALGTAGSAIPEPSSVALVGLCSLLGLTRRRR